jgi:hypothetical protein
VIPVWAKGNEEAELMNLFDLMERPASIDKQVEARGIKDRLSFDVWAEQQGINENERDRIWSAVETEKQLESARELGFAELGVKEKELYQQVQQFTDRIGLELRREREAAGNRGRREVTARNMACRAAFEMGLRKIIESRDCRKTGKGTIKNK